MFMMVGVPVVAMLEPSSLKLNGSGWTVIGRRACEVGGASSNLSE